jgi:glycine/D-amino acid oxidase-like deaminating enzyme
MNHTSSYYAATANAKAVFPQLTTDITTDVAIIGGGFTGVATALELAERGLSVVLCEANQIGWGATGRNGGQITGSLSGDKAMEREFRRTIGDQAADFVWNLRWRGHDIIRKRIEKYKIDCDLRFGQMQTALTKGQLTDLEVIYTTGSHRGMSEYLEMISRADMPDYLETDLYIGGLLNHKNMHLHALNFCLGQAEAVVSLGGKVFERSEVISIEHGPNPVVRTQNGSVRADKIMLAGNAYHLLEQKKLRGKLFPASLANMATAPLSKEDAAAINPHNLAVYDGRFVLDYYRLTADNRVMFGGGTNYSGRDSQDVARELRPALERTFPRLKGIDIDYSWSGMDGIILNRIPQVGRIGAKVFYVQGYSGHGIALSHILAELTAQCINGDPEGFEVFENCRHLNLPVSRTIGSIMIAVGMAYYTLRDKFEI